MSRTNENQVTLSSLAPVTNVDLIPSGTQAATEGINAPELLSEQTLQRTLSLSRMRDPPTAEPSQTILQSSSTTVHELYAPYATKSSDRAALDLLRAYQEKDMQNEKSPLRKAFKKAKMRSGFSKDVLSMALAQVAAEGSLPVIESLLSLGADVNYYPAKRLEIEISRALPAAARYDRVQVVDYLISKGSNQETINIAFVIACDHGFVGLAENLLVKHKADLYFNMSTAKHVDEISGIELVDKDETAFHAVSTIEDKKKQLTLLELFMRQPQFRVYKRVYRNSTALSLFTASSSLEAVRALLEAGASQSADPSAIDTLNFRFAHTAIEILYLLLTFGITTSSSEVLSNAVKAGCLEAVNLILARLDIDPNSLAYCTGGGHDKGDFSLLGFATYINRLDIVEALVDGGAETWRGARKSRQGKPPIYYASFRGSNKMLEYFIEQNPDLADGDCLSTAARHSRLMAVKTLLHHLVNVPDDIWIDVLGTKPDAQNREDYLQMIDLILLKPTSITARAMQVAIDKENFMGVEKLMKERTAEMERLVNKRLWYASTSNSKVWNVCTPLQYARSNGAHSAFLSLLKAHGGKDFIEVRLTKELTEERVSLFRLFSRPQ